MATSRSRLAVVALIVGTAVAGCTAGTAAPTTSSASGTVLTTGSAPTGAGTTATSGTAAAGTVFDAGTVHSIAINVDDAALKTMLQTYVDSGDKDWITATVTIDGTTFSKVGIKLKGNSSLRGITVASAPQDLPWRIRLDKYVDGQNLDGYSDFTVRANSTQTSLNEAVSLALLRTAGLASEEAVQTRFSVNGSDEVVRLTVQNLDDRWVEDNFAAAGDDSVLYKAEASGNWSFKGEDADYSSSFEIEAGKDDQYAPLAALLDLVNNGTADEIAAKLPTMLDIDAFARYLAFEDLVDNFDDIDGPGNNAYLFWDSATQKFTVVAWDHNLAFGSRPGGQGGAGGPGQGTAAGGNDQGGAAGENGQGGTRPTGMPAPGNGQGAPGGQGAPDGGGRAGGGDNPLVKTFKANADWVAIYDRATTDLKAQLFTSGVLTRTVDAAASVLSSGASDLVSADTITTEADAIRTYATS